MSNSTASTPPSVIKLALTMLEWVLAAVLLVIASINVGPEVSIMLGAVVIVAVAIIVRNRHHRQHPDRAGDAPDISEQTAARHRYLPEHPGSNAG